MKITLTKKYNIFKAISVFTGLIILSINVFLMCSPNSGDKGDSQINKNDITNIEFRKTIFKEIAIAEKKAQDEADIKFPPTMVKQNADYYDQLATKYRNEIMKKYKINENQKGDIVLEGVQNKWHKY